MTERSTAITGTAGEHFVASRLATMGYVVALTRGGSPSIDLLIATADGSRTAILQVKTSSSALRGRNPTNTFWEWPVGWGAADLEADRLWYAFVDLRSWPDEKDYPEVYLVPSGEVAAQIQYERKHKWSRSFFRLGTPEGKEYSNRDLYREQRAKFGEAIKR